MTATALTPAQQGTTDRARRFLADRDDPDAYSPGVARAHIELLLAIIDDLTGSTS